VPGGRSSTSPQRSTAGGSGNGSPRGLGGRTDRWVIVEPAAGRDTEPAADHGPVTPVRATWAYVAAGDLMERQWSCGPADVAAGRPYGPASRYAAPDVALEDRSRMASGS